MGVLDPHRALSNNSGNESAAFDPTVPPLRIVTVLYGVEAAKCIWDRATLSSGGTAPSDDKLFNALRVFVDERDEEDAIELMRINACEIDYERTSDDDEK